MNWLKKHGGRIPLSVLALTVGTCGLSRPAPAQTGTPQPPSPSYTVCEGGNCDGHGHAQGVGVNGKPVKPGILDRHYPKDLGTLGYGPPGVFPGFQGFGLGYHLGYGYGGDARGPGAEGGYPLYGGPGYPHAWPILKRCGGIAPFFYYGGPGYPDACHPNFYGGIGGAVPEKPVIQIGDDRYDVGYGGFTGAIPYSEEQLAPFTTRAGAYGSSSGVSSEAPAPPPVRPAPSPIPGPSSDRGSEQPAPDRSLGIDSEPVRGGAVNGMKVARVYRDSSAEKAGLHAGDVIVSANGYVTQQPGHLEWIVANAAKDNVVQMNVRTASDNQQHTIQAQLP